VAFVEKSTLTLRYTTNGLICYIDITGFIYVIWFTNLRVSSFSLSTYNAYAILQTHQNH